MWMSDEEIKESYVRAASSKEQIKILAELNACPLDYIIDSLRRSGLNIKKKSQKQAAVKQRRIQGQYDKEVVEKWDRYVESMTILGEEYKCSELVELTGIPYTTVHSYLRDFQRPSTKKFEQFLRGICMTREQFFTLESEN